MNVFKALATVVGTAIAFAVCGVLIGMLLGSQAPGFIRQMIPPRDPINYHPEQIAFGLGLINGLYWGLGIGVVLVAILTWKEIRLTRRDVESPRV